MSGWLEGVLERRVQGALVQELPCAQHGQRLGQILVGKLDDLAQDRVGELLADHGGRLQHVLLPLAEPIDPRGERGVHACRHVDLVDRRSEPVGAARSGEVL